MFERVYFIFKDWYSNLKEDHAWEHEGERN